MKLLGEDGRMHRARMYVDPETVIGGSIPTAYTGPEVAEAEVNDLLDSRIPEDGLGPAGEYAGSVAVQADIDDKYDKLYKK